MQTLRTHLLRLHPVIGRSNFSSTINLRELSTNRKAKHDDDQWNDAWETAWLPEDLSSKDRAPWETDVNFPSSSIESNPVPTSDADADTKAFMEDMNENWDQRKGKSSKTQKQESPEQSGSGSLYSLDNLRKDYRLKKQRIHAGLWVKEIEKMEEAKLDDGIVGGDDIEKLLDSCSDIFYSSNNDLNNSKIPSTSEFKNKPDGWETATKAQDGNVWEMTQREEDILLQEFDRRIAYCKFQISSFIKTHIFSRRRPIDGWKYMIEEIGPNARKGKGSVSRFPSLSDPATQPFKEEKPLISSSVSPYRKR